MKYFFTPDKAVIITSILCIVAIGYMLYCFVNADKWYYDISSLLVVGLFIFFALKTPYCVYVGDDSVVVKQVMGSIKITDIESIRSVGKKDLANSIRKFGNGGFFGYVGYFSSPTLGNFYMAAINTKELAIVSTQKGKTYVINYPLSLLEKK